MEKSDVVTIEWEVKMAVHVYNNTPTKFSHDALVKKKHSKIQIKP
ncbi:hypothetical protein [Photobacterium leiognathi]